MMGPAAEASQPARANPVAAWWHRMFLAERPSVSLAFFRIAVAITVGCHMIPAFLQIEDNYLATAFKEKNGSFFPIWTLQLVEASPDWLVKAMVGVFMWSWLSFLVGFRAQVSAIVMTLCCYYFYALNSLHIGTLSFDILLVTLSLIVVTGYHGDWLSVDALMRGDPRGSPQLLPNCGTSSACGLGRAPLRPFFIQRLLQLQIAWTYFYTALSKITAGGNWLTDAPYYYLMNYPAIGVVKAFPFRGFLAPQPQLCHWIGIAVLCCEMSMPALLFIRRTRPFGIALGFFFHVLLLVTLHVPTIFFFLFPPQLLLFVEPETIVGWIDRLRAKRAAIGGGDSAVGGEA